MSGTRIAIGYLPVSLKEVCNNPTALDYMQRIIPNLYQAVFQPCSLPKDLSFGIFQLAWHAEPTSWFGTAGFLAELWYSKTTKTRGRPRDQPKPPAPANNPMATIHPGGVSGCKCSCGISIPARSAYASLVSPAFYQGRAICSPNRR